MVTEHDDAQPNRQGVFYCTGNTEEEEMEVVMATNRRLGEEYYLI